MVLPGADMVKGKVPVPPLSAMAGLNAARLTVTPCPDGVMDTPFVNTALFIVPLALL